MTTGRPISGSREDREQNCYGCSLADLKASVERAFTLSGPAMIAMSMMSDAQEEIAHGMTEEARKTLNRAKWVIGEYLWKHEDGRQA